MRLPEFLDAPVAQVDQDGYTLYELPYGTGATILILLSTLMMPVGFQVFFLIVVGLGMLLESWSTKYPNGKHTSS